MHGLSEHQILLSFLAIAVLLVSARAAAEGARRLGQPEVLGELLGGFLIGPSVLGALFPAYYHGLFGNIIVSQALSLLSWIGAILLLLIAGLEADLHILRKKATPGLLAAAGAISASLLAGTWIAWRLLGRSLSDSFFLGVALSVTAVSVVAKLLIERESLRRDYGQVMLAAGIASEVLVWPMISVLSSIHQRSNPWIAGVRATVLAVAFFAFMLTLGRRFTFWAMRRVADVSGLASRELSLILLLMCVSAVISASIGLHPLLGAFVFGVLLSRAPRATVALKERLQSLTIAFFAPIFFGAAGMRVNLFELHGMRSIEGVLVLFAAAGVIKIALGALGAAAGRLPLWESASVGVGLNLKGGSDVVVAIVGTELGLLGQDLYTIYAVVAILTVIVSPRILGWLATKTPPGEDELERLNREEARRRAYLADMERILVPMIPELMPSLAAQVVQCIATTKQQEREIFDITELTASRDTTLARSDTPADLVRASDQLAQAAENENVELQQVATEEDVLSSIQEAAAAQQIVAIGARKAEGDLTISFGPLQDQLIQHAATDVLITIADMAELPRASRILVPVNGLEHSLAAADVAAYIGKATNAEIVLFNVMHSRLDVLFWREREHRDLLQAGYTIVREAQFRIARLNVRQSERVRLGSDPAEAVLAELNARRYDMVVLGAVARSGDGRLSLGSAVEHILRRTNVARVLLISKGTESGV